MTDPDSVLEALRTLTESLQEQYAFTDKQLQQAIFTQHVPATIFSENATPLESIISYLSSTGQEPNEIAKQLGRNTAYIKQVLTRGKKHAEPEKTPHTIPLQLLRKESAGKAITTHLATQGLSNAEIAQLLKKNPSTVWTWKKRGEAQ